MYICRAPAGCVVKLVRGDGVGPRVHELDPSNAGRAEAGDPDPGLELIVPEHPIAPRITTKRADARMELR